MKSTKRFSKKWKYGLVGASFAILFAGGVSLGIALASQNRTLSIASPYFVGQNSYVQFNKTLQQKFKSTDPSTLSYQQWQAIQNDTNYASSNVGYFRLNQDGTLINTSPNNFGGLSNFNTNINGKNQDVLQIALNNLEQNLNNRPILLRDYTLDSANFFNSSVTLFTNSAFNTIHNATNGLVNLKLIPRSPSTVAQIFFHQSGELVSMFWSPDYNDVSAWLGYLFSENNSWCTGNLWPCLWDYLAGANPINGSFVFNQKTLPDAQISVKTMYSNAGSFPEQLMWTNARRNAMGLGDLPPWAVSLYQTLFSYFPNSIAWNTPYGWWPLQYNNNDADGLLQYVIQNWAAKAEKTQFTLSADNKLISNSLPDGNEAYSSLMPFIRWIDSLAPTLPFYSGANNTTRDPVLSRKGVFITKNPANGYFNSQYFVNQDQTDYNSGNKFVLFMPTSIVEPSNSAYFSPVVGSQGFPEWASGMYSGLMNFVPYNFNEAVYQANQDKTLKPGETGWVNPYSAGWGLTKKPSQTILKLMDAKNLILLKPNSNFQGAYYNKNGQLVRGDILQYWNSQDNQPLKNANAQLLFVANPYYLAPKQYKHNKGPYLTKTQYDNWIESNPGKTWSTYQLYQDFLETNAINPNAYSKSSAPNLATAEMEASIYQYKINTNIPWTNDNGQVVNHLTPQDFLDPITWMAASYSMYSFNQTGQTLGQVQGNSYMLQEVGIAGNGYNLGQGTGFFQTEAYAPNSANSSSAYTNPTVQDTFTYFLSPKRLKTTKTGAECNENAWSGGEPISYFLSMIGTDGEYFDPIPAFANAFNNLPQYSNVKIGALNSMFLGDSTTTGVWNLSTMMKQALANGAKKKIPVAQNKKFQKYYDEINQLPVYKIIVANQNINGEPGVYDLYGSGINPNTGLPQMGNNIYFDGGYYAVNNTFTNASLDIAINPAFFSNLTNAYGDPLLGPSAQKVGFLQYKWSGNITTEEELTLYKYNQISCDFTLQANQLENYRPSGTQFLYFVGQNNVEDLDEVLYNAQIYNLTNLKNGFSVPMNQVGQPLVVIDQKQNADGVYDNVINGTTYYGVYGYPYLNKDGQIAFTNDSDTTGLLKSTVSVQFAHIVGTVLDPFLYGTTGAEVRQDINALINWTAIATNASHPLPEDLVSVSAVPYGNFKQNFTYYYPGDNKLEQNTVGTFFQFASAVPGYGILGAPLYCTYTQKNGLIPYYVGNLNNDLDGFSQGEWNLINAVNGW